MRVLPYGERALLVEVADHRHAMALYEDVRRQPVEGVIDLVPAARTLLMTFIDEPSARSAVAAVSARTIVPGQQGAGPLVEIPIVYDGSDLEVVATMTGLSVETIIAKHEAPDYAVAFIGFAPGFAYLTGLDAALWVPRRSTPRTRVPSGAVAIGGEFTAIYPGVSPGGWQLIGHSTASMWDLDREPAALLQPGSRVRFVRSHR
jgi:KipI family sensor histidine kinase inhibitor